MCLTVDMDWTKRDQKKKNLTVYKVLTLCDDWKGNIFLRTPYEVVRVEIGDILQAQCDNLYLHDRKPLGPSVVHCAGDFETALHVTHSFFTPCIILKFKI